MGLDGSAALAPPEVSDAAIRAALHSIAATRARVDQLVDELDIARRNLDAAERVLAEAVGGQGELFIDGEVLTIHQQPGKVAVIQRRNVRVVK
jgi:hypothetical protein